MTIRRHLLILVAGAFLPLLVFGVALTSYSWWQQRNALETRYLERARAMTIVLDTELDASLRVMRSLAYSPDLDAQHMPDFLDRMRRVLATQPLWSRLAVGDAAWKHVSSVGRPEASRAPPAIQPALLARVEATQLPQVSELLRGPDGHYETQVAMPVARGGDVRNVLLVTMEQDRWHKFLGQYPVGRGAVMTLLDQAGTIIARTAHNARWAGKRASSDVLRKTREMAAGAYRGTGLDGEPYYIAHSRSARWGWTVATGVPASAIEAVVLRSSAALALAAFASIALAVLLAFLIGRRIQRPIVALGASARALAREDAPPSHVRSNIDEVDAAERAFAEASTLLRHRREALADALGHAQQARREAERASQAKDEFLAMLGHELRNPLNAITGAVGVLHQVDPHGPQAMRSREIIDRQMLALRGLVDDLLDVARVTSGKISLTKEVIDLGQVASRTAAMMRAGGRLAGRRVRLDCGEAWVCADPTRIEQIAANLLDNAAKYTPAGGAVCVDVRAEAHEAVLEVRDTGMGIGPDLLPRIFDLFSQGERTIDRAQGGLGLGLALVRRLAELHGGTVAAASEGPGRGARFTVRLPLARSPLPAGAPAVPSSTAQEEEAKRLKIVVVEDNEDGRETLSMMLRIEGHEVHEADSGPNGVDAMARVHPDVAIVDIGLPGFDGYEVARRTRADATTRGVRLVALTGYGQEEDRRQATAAGFDWFLVKPADMTMLDDILAHV